MVDASRAQSEVARLHGDELRGRAVAVPVGQSVDLVTDADAGGAKAQAGDDPGQLVAGDHRRSIVATAIDPRRRPLQLSGRVARTVHLDERVACAELGCRRRLVHELVRSSTRMESQRVHATGVPAQAGFVWLTGVPIPVASGSPGYS